MPKCPSATRSAEAYLAYAEAKALIDQGTDGPDAAARRIAVQNLLDTALEHDPVFAEAYAWKAYVYARSKSGAAREERSRQDELMSRLAERHAALALERDPSLSLAHAVLARLHAENTHNDEAEREAEEALRLSADDPEVLAVFALVETQIRRRPGEAVGHIRRAIAIAPNDSRLYAQLGTTLLFLGEREEAEAALERCRALSGQAAHCALS